METEDRIVVFDGLCNLCSGGARWLEHHQAEPPFRLVPMQSDQGRAHLTQHGYDPDDPLTFLVLDGGERLAQSDTWIHLMAAAGGGWRLIQALAAGVSVVQGDYRAYARMWFWLGVPAFAVVVLVFWLMVAKPEL